MKTCTQCQTEFQVTDEDRVFYQKVKVPEPTHCPPCRQQRRLSFRNDSNYYHNTCHLCLKKLISIYSPDKPIQVLCSDCFWSDRFDPLEYGQDFDFNRPFFEQYGEMRAKVPRLAIFNTQSENAEYTVHSSKNRSCYMGSSLVDCEDAHYSDWAMKSKDCMDLLYSTEMEQCYQCTDCQGCTFSSHLELCSNVSECFLCFDCRGGKNLVGCVSLRNKANQILNQPASEREVKEVIQKLKTDAVFFREFKVKYEALKMQLPKPEAWFKNAETCSGNYVMDSKNIHDAYHSRNSEDCRYVYDAIDAKDGYDITRNAGVEMLYECKGTVDLRFSQFCNLTYQSDNMFYCDNSQASNNCFGGMSLKRHQYCILNKQYSKEDYEVLISKIVEHMKSTKEYGEFFPVALSPFGYNETKAQEFFPMTKQEVIAKGWHWTDYETPLSENLKSIPAQQLPQNIQDVPDDILNWAIVCEATGKPFRIIKQELQFYRNRGLPIPHRSPQARRAEQVALQNPRKLFERKCDNCGKEIQTTYSPDRPEIVYCEVCYLSVIY